jgi:hypothetical protein
VVAAALLVAVFATSCSSSKDVIADDAGGGEGTSWSVPDGGGTLVISDTSELVVPAGSVTPGAAIRITSGSPGDDALDEMSSAGDAVHLDVEDGRLQGPVTLRFRVSAPPEGHVPVVATWDGGQWLPVGGDYDPATSTLTVTTDHFSWWKPWTWNISGVMRKTFDTVFGEVDTSAMTCPDGDAEIGAGYRVALTDAGTAFSGCARADGDEVEITLKNRRRGAFIVEIPSNWSAHVVDALDFSTMVTNEVFNITSRRFVVIPGGEKAVFRGQLATGQRVSMPVSQDLFSWSIDTMLYALSVYSATVGSAHAGATDSLSSIIRQTNDRLGLFRDGLSCLSGSHEWLSAATSDPESPDAAQGLVPAIWECAKAAFPDGALGLVALLIDLVVTPFRQIFKLGEMAVDMVTGSSNRRLEVLREGTGASSSGGGTGGSAGGAGASITPLGGGRSTYSETYFADIGTPMVTGDFTVAIPFDARGRSDLRRPETSCLVHPSGYRAVPLSVSLTTKELSHYAGTIEFAVIVPGDWSFRYSCANDYSAVPVASVAFAQRGMSVFSNDYYVTVLDVVGDGGETIVSFVSQGHTAARGDLRDPLTSCLEAGASKVKATSAAYSRKVDGYYYAGTLRFPTSSSGVAFRYSCMSDYTALAL